MAARLVFLFLLLAAIPAYAKERITLNTRYSPNPNTTGWFEVERAEWDPRVRAFVVVLIGEFGIRRAWTIPGDRGRLLERLLNRPGANSRDRRILERLISDGELAGMITGDPD